MAVAGIGHTTALNGEGFSVDGIENPSGRIYDEAADCYIFRHKRVVTNGIDSLSDALLCIVKTFKPMVEVDSAVLYKAEGSVGNAARPHLLLHSRPVHMASTAMRMGYDHNILNAEFVDSHEEATHDTAERMEDDAAGVFDEFGIAIPDA